MNFIDFTRQNLMGRNIRGIMYKSLSHGDTIEGVVEAVDEIYSSKGGLCIVLMLSNPDHPTMYHNTKVTILLDTLIVV